MKKKQLVIMLIALSSVSLYAQPSEELPVITVQEMSDEEKRLFLPQEEKKPAVKKSIKAPLKVTTSNQIARPVAIEIPQKTETLNTITVPTPITVGGVTDITPTTETLAAPVDGTIPGLNFGASLGFKPFGFENVNGIRHNYFSISPGVDLSTKLATASNKAVDLNVSYGFTWKEFLEQDSDVARGFENVATFGLSGKLNEQWGYDAGLYGEWYHLNGPDRDGENYLLLSTAPTLNMAINDKVSLALTYHMDYLQLYNVDVSLIDSLGGGFDAGDFGGGAFSDAGFGVDTSDESLNELGFSNPKTDLAWMENLLGTKVSITPVKGTTVSLNYRYAFKIVSNNPNSEWKGHLIRPKVSQVLPWWEGASFSYELRIRQRNYDSATEGDKLKANRRFRHELNFSQKINDSLSAGIYFRQEINSSNADDYFARGTAQKFNTSLSYTF